VVCQAVEQGTGQAFVTGEDLRPFRERKIGRYDQTGLFIALAEEAEQVLGASAIQRDVAQLIDDADRVRPRFCRSVWPQDE